jgi:two-component system, chemotaxis family, chemotaxis protein CheY
MTQILIADDSPTIRRMVRASLLRSFPAAEFVEAGSGLEALEKLAIGRTALMVLDLNMPDMHGLEVLQFVRAHQSYRHLPVLVLTTRGDESSREAAARAGATTYLTKPFTPDSLAAEARRLLDADAGVAADSR